MSDLSARPSIAKQNCRSACGRSRFTSFTFMSGTLCRLLRMTGFLEGLSKAPTKARSAGLAATINIGTDAEISRRKYSMEAASCLPLMFWTLTRTKSRLSKARMSWRVTSPLAGTNNCGRGSPRGANLPKIWRLPGFTSPVSCTRSIEMKEAAGNVRWCNLLRRRSIACSQSR